MEKYDVEDVLKWMASSQVTEPLTLDDTGFVLPDELSFYNDEYNHYASDKEGRRAGWFEGAFETVVAESEEQPLQGEVRTSKTEHSQVDILPSEWTEFAVMIPDHKGIPRNYSFAERPYLPTPYDIQCYRMLLMCGRQVEKCVVPETIVYRENGEPVEIRHIALGDKVMSYNDVTHRVEAREVIFVSKRIYRECLRIRTSLGAILTVGADHPIRQWGYWTKAHRLRNGDMVLTTGQLPVSTQDESIPDGMVHLIAIHALYGRTGYAWVVCAKEDVEAIRAAYEEQGVRFLRIVTERSNTCTCAFSSLALRKRLESVGMGLRLGKHAKRLLPPVVFSLPLEQRRKLLYWLFAYSKSVAAVRRGTENGYNVTFRHTSEGMAKQVQALFWSVGVLTRLNREMIGTGHYLPRYCLRVIGEESLRYVMEEMGFRNLLSEEYDAGVIKESLNSGRRRVDRDIGLDFQLLYHTRVGDLDPSDEPHQHGLSLSFHTNTTADAVAPHIAYFRARPTYFDQRELDKICHVISSKEFYWDYVVQIDEVGIKECIDISVEGTHSFIAEGVVTHNSTLLGNSILARMAITPHFRALYVSPTHEQTKTFRRDRIGDPISLSPVYQSYLIPGKSNNMSLVKFINFAQLVLRYAYLTADRVRGIPADAVYIDEIQDILTANLPVIEECAGHANPLLKMFVYSGTPKTYDNTIESLWSTRSTQNEWAVPSEARRIFDMKPGDAKDRAHEYYWNVPLDEGNIGLEGLVCKTYGGRINPRHPDARWVSMNPNIRNHPRLEPFESFRIPQLMVPWIQWSEILDKQESYPRSRFYNEVLALPFDAGTRPLRMSDLMDASRSDLRMLVALNAIARAVAGKQVFFGIDWGTGENTYTVLTIGSYLGGVGSQHNFTIFYFHRFTGPELDPELQMQTIHNYIALFKPVLVGVDYGGGFDRNKFLINRYGPQRIVRYQYIGGHGSTSRRPKILFDGTKGRYMLERTEVMSDFFNAIREGKIDFPMWEDWSEPYAQDFLSIFSEYNEVTRTTRYDVGPEKTDDAFHSALYCFFVSQIMYPRPDIVRPTLERA